jgi:hypothetical protein
VRQLYAERSGPRVLLMPDHEDRAAMLRQHLQQAGVDRRGARVRRRPSQAHHLSRATRDGHHLVRRGDDPLRIGLRAGHTAFSTTEIYIREAENLAHALASRFPTERPRWTQMGGSGRGSLVLPPPYVVEQRGIEHGAARPVGQASTSFRELGKSETPSMDADGV